MRSLVLITGATSGLGMQIAREIAKEGTPLLLTGRNKQVLDQLQKELLLHTKVSILKADLSIEEERKTILDAIGIHQPDLVINSAGFGLYGAATSFPLEEQLNMLKTNTEALTAITLRAAQTLIEKKKTGIIMNISSAASYLHYPGLAVYSASKAYVTHFSQALDFETAPHGVRVLVSCPGQIATSFRKRASKGYDQSQKNYLTLSVEHATCLILKQIKEKKTVEVIDYRYKILLFIARFLIPKKRLYALLQKEIEKRIKPLDPE